MASERPLKIDVKRIRRELESEYKDRKRVTLYLSEDLYKAFTKACKPHAASAVIQKLMKAYIDSN